ncbi:MAG TPA: TIGR00730 family Rossman fold protein [Acidobacteriota bacterium]|nr:TIGR00730 family Rossman fold protein [Acidobacteriota bacterium]
MRLCVFCGSSPGGNPEYRQTARQLGQQLLRRKVGLVYGGGSIGLMGVVADTVLEGGGEAIGVLPSSMARKEVAHDGLTHLHLVEGMHPRKAKMAELSHGFIALPGGFGTYEELFEVITWSQLRFHRKPVGVLNVAGYFDPLMKMVDHGIQEGFIRPENRSILVVRDSAQEVVDAVLQQAPSEEKTWVDLKEI